MEYSIKPKRFGRKENNPLPSKEDNWIIRDNMNCPKCGEEMQLGYIQCRDGVYWSPKIRMIAALPTTKGMIKLDNDDCGALSGGATEAYKCEKCRQIVIKY